MYYYCTVLLDTYCTVGASNISITPLANLCTQQLIHCWNAPRGVHIFALAQHEHIQFNFVYSLCWCWARRQKCTLCGSPSYGLTNTAISIAVLGWWPSWRCFEMFLWVLPSAGMGYPWCFHDTIATVTSLAFMQDMRRVEREAIPELCIFLYAV